MCNCACVCVRVYIWKEKQFHQCLVNKWHLKSQTSANRNQQDDRASLTGLLGNATLWEKYSFQCCHYSRTLSHELLISIIVMIGMRWISTCMVRETLKQWASHSYCTLQSKTYVKLNIWHVTNYKGMETKFNALNIIKLHYSNTKMLLGLKAMWPASCSCSHYW